MDILTFAVGFCECLLGRFPIQQWKVRDVRVYMHPSGPQANIYDCVIILGVGATPFLSMWKKLSGWLIKLSKKSFDKGMGLLPSLNQTPAPENRPSPPKK